MSLEAVHPRCHCAFGRSPLTGVSLLLIVALALGASVKSGRADLSGLVTSGSADRVSVPSGQPAAHRVARRAAPDRPVPVRPPVPRAAAEPGAAVERAAGVEGLPAPRAMLESLIDLPPPRG